MKVISLEDARRVFLATVKLIYLNNSPTYTTYELSKNQDRTNLPDNSGDVINIPSQKFKKALETVIRQFGLHPEQKNVFVKTFLELHWIMRPKDQKHKYRKETTSRCRVGGKDTAVYRIDRIIFDFLEDMDGVKAVDISNNLVYVPKRGPDGDLITKDGSTLPTTVTTGHVSDAAYESVSNHLNERIKMKDAE